MPISAIVVNYNAGELLSDCVGALLRSLRVRRVLVIDNASPDGSGQALASRFREDERVDVIFNDENRGFASAVNQGLVAVGDDDALVVNPDCVVAAGAIERMADALESDPRAGLVAPLVTDATGQPERSAIRRLPRARSALVTATGLHRLQAWLPGLAGVSALDDGLPTEVTVVEAVSGACMLIRRAALSQAGAFDEGFAMHCEDLDLMARFAAAGWHCLLVPEARAVHHQGHSSRSRPLWVHVQKHRGMIRYYRKHEASTHSWPLRMLIEAGAWLRCLLLAPLALLRR